MEQVSNFPSGRPSSDCKLGCEVCLQQKLPVKYKCPKCYLKYCSIDCWKTHRRTECQKSADDVQNLEIDQTGSLQMMLFPTDDTVHPTVLEKLRYDNELKEMLRNPAIRDIIAEVDKAQNVRHAMQQAMLEPLFVEFADRCLALVDPDTDQNSEVT